MSSTLFSSGRTASEIGAVAGTVYMNAASTGPLLVRALEALNAFNAKRVVPWTIRLDEQLGGLARSRELCARLINASADEIALTPNTSTGLHVAMRCLPIPPGNIILGHEAEFPANVYPWMSLERTRGVPYERVPLRDGLPDHETLIERVERGGVGLVALSWVSFLSGDRADLGRIGEVCRRTGTWFVVDAIQGVGAVRLDVRRCHIDILSCGAQKWLCSPWGSAFTYIRRDLLERLEPYTGGWLSVQGSEDFSRMVEYDLSYFGDARKFEVATIPYQDFIGMNAALEVFFDLGLGPIEEHVRTITARLIDGIDGIPGLTLITPRDPERRAGIVSCTADRVDAVARRLVDAGVMMSVRAGGVLRFSPHFYNTVDEIDHVLEVLDR
jgi:cysteine desulfurase/selenocysteine lyase